MLEATRHKVCYYETDAMKCVHHSNYIRWFEQARTDFFEQIGLPYDEIERDGYAAPVLSVSCDYKEMTRYGESVYITVCLERFTGISYTLAYEVIGAQDRRVKVKGKTKMCLIDQSGKIVNIKRLEGRYYSLFADAVGRSTEIPE